MADFLTTDIELYLSRIPHSEFLKLHQCEYDPRPYIFARECWERYDAQADNVKSPGRLLGDIICATYAEAVQLGFGGDVEAWGKAIKDAQPREHGWRRHEK